jgi:hypothetical protein
MAMLAVLSKMAAGNRHKKRLQVDSIPGGTDHPGLYILYFRLMILLWPPVQQPKFIV